MQIPSKRERYEWLAETSMGDNVILCRYDHHTDNYEITVNGEFVWGSNGFTDHNIAEMVFKAVVDGVGESK